LDGCTENPADFERSKINGINGFRNRLCLSHEEWEKTNVQVAVMALIYRVLEGKR
jgi:hypothetical protein